MEQNKIGEVDVVYEVSQQGYFPPNMKLVDYPVNFIQFLIANWQQVKDSIYERVYGGKD